MSPGEILAILGLLGSSKSTLFNVLSSMDDNSNLDHVLFKDLIRETLFSYRTEFGLSQPFTVGPHHRIPPHDHLDRRPHQNPHCPRRQGPLMLLQDFFPSSPSRQARISNPMAGTLFSKLSNDVVLNILVKLEEDPRDWARLACSCTKFSSMIHYIAFCSR
ncbi:hypothetical protein ACFX13_021849 [Malus domestica]